jgi:peptide/nickel transport system substrate-binding protein
MKRRHFLKATAALGGGTLLAACAPGTVVPAPTGTSSAATIKRGGILKWQSTSTPGINVSQNIAGANLWIMGAVYERLLTYRANSFTDSELAPGLVDKWEVSSDAKRVTLNIHPGVKWQNIAPVSGREFTSDDLKWNVEYYQTKAPATKYIFDSVERVDTPDKYTAILTLKAANVAFPTNLADKHAFMYPREVFEQKGSFNDVAIGTGPFVLKSWEPNVKVILEARKDYWQMGADGKALPYLDGIESYVVPDYQARLAGLKANQYDEFYQPHGVLKTDAEDLKRLGVIITESRDAFHKALLFNNADPVMQDARLRRAISFAIDRKAFIDVNLDGVGKVTDFVPLPGWEQDEAAVTQKFGRNLTEARRLLTEAGKSGAKLTISAYKAGPAGQNEKAALFVIDNLKEVGLDVTMESTTDFTTFNNTVIIPGKFQMQLLVQGDGPDPDNFLRGYLSDQPPTTNRMRVKDTRLDTMILEQRTIVDVGRRKTAVMNIQNYLYEQMYVAPMPQVVLLQARHPWVKGYGGANGAANHLSGTLRPERIWLDK